MSEPDAVNLSTHHWNFNTKIAEIDIPPSLKPPSVPRRIRRKINLLVKLTAVVQLAVTCEMNLTKADEMTLEPDKNKEKTMDSSNSKRRKILHNL